MTQFQLEKKRLFSLLSPAQLPQMFYQELPLKVYTIIFPMGRRKN